MPRLFDIITEDEIFKAILAKPEPEDFATIAEFANLSVRMIEAGMPMQLISGTMAALVCIDNYIRHNWKQSA